MVFDLDSAVGGVMVAQVAGALRAALGAAVLSVMASAVFVSMTPASAGGATVVVDAAVVVARALTVSVEAFSSASAPAVLLADGETSFPAVCAALPALPP